MRPDADVLATVTQDQSRSYGEQFCDIYDLVFPQASVDAERIATALRALAPAGGARFVELGVGSGRVAVPLARRGAEVTGVDSSPELLALAGEHAERAGVALTLVQDDIRRWRGDGRADVAYCICSTISMLATTGEQAAALSRAAAAVRPGGHVVVETHSPDRVRRLHACAETVSWEHPVAGIPGGLTTQSQLRARSSRWRVHYRWTAGGRSRTASEFSTLTTPEDLDTAATGAGLRLLERVSDWDSAPHDRFSPTYISVYRAT